MRSAVSPVIFRFPTQHIHGFKRELSCLRLSARPAPPTESAGSNLPFGQARPSSDVVAADEICCSQEALPPRRRLDTRPGERPLAKKEKIEREELQGTILPFRRI